VAEINPLWNPRDALARPFGFHRIVLNRVDRDRCDPADPPPICREQERNEIRFTFQALLMMLGLALAQDPNYHGRNYQQDDGQAQTDSRRPTSTTPIPILHWNKQQEHDGTYKTRCVSIFSSIRILEGTTLESGDRSRESLGEGARISRRFSSRKLYQISRDPVWKVRRRDTSRARGVDRASPHERVRASLAVSFYVT